MTREQFKRANAVVYSVFIVIMGYVFLSLIAFIAYSEPSGVTWKTYIQMIGAIAGIIISTAAFIVKRDTKLCAIAMVLSGVAMYVIIRLVGTTEDSCMYAFPILFVAITYLDIKLVAASNGMMLVANVLRVLINMDKINEASGSTMVVSIFVGILVAYASIRVTRILIKFDNENMEVILDASKKQEESQKLMITVAENIIKHFKTAMEMFDTMQEALSNGHVSMTNIADSTVSTAEAIQGQEQICREIRNQAEHAGEVTNQMLASSAKVSETVQEGVSSVQELGRQADNVSLSSKMMEEVITELTNKVEQVADEVQVLSDNMEEVKNSMKETVTSSNTIYDHITQLSATSEEVAASSNEGLENSNVTVSEVEKCKKIFESIYELAQDLKTY